MWPFGDKSGVIIDDKELSKDELVREYTDVCEELQAAKVTAASYKKAAEEFAEFECHHPYWSDCPLGLIPVRTLKDADARMAEMELYISVLEGCLSERDVSAAKSLFERLMKVKCPQSEGDEGVL